MKNIQVIDGATNCVYDIFAATGHRPPATGFREDAECAHEGTGNEASV